MLRLIPTVLSLSLASCVPALTCPATSPGPTSPPELAAETHLAPAPPAVAVPQASAAVHGPLAHPATFSVPPLLTEADGRFDLRGLASTVSLSCRLNKTAFYKFDEGQLEPAEEEMRFQIDAIALHAGTARLIGNLGASDVTVSRTSGGSMHIVEATSSGTINTLVVFPIRSALDDAFLAAFSRHVVGVRPTPMVSQYVGTCKPLLQ
jgi:hypothetical protein